MSPRTVYLAAFIVLLSSAVPAMGVRDSDFIIDFNDVRPVASNRNGDVRLVLGINNDGLMGTGYTVAKVDLERGAVLQPHYHVRSAEILLILKGTFRVCFVREDSSRVCNDVREGQIAIIPAGTIHYAQNVGSGDGSFFAALNDDNPGTYFLPAALFQLPSEALSAVFDMPLTSINNARNGLAPLPAAQNARPAPNVGTAIRRSQF